MLFEDETALRMFPPLRAAWAYQGEQAVVGITGRNAKRTLFATINPRTGHRILMRRWKARQPDFQDFLRLLRHRHGNRPVALLLDRAPCHEAAKSQQVAAKLKVWLLWLPKQCSELNAMDQLWKELKRRMSANRQFATIDHQAEYAERWVLGLSNRQALRKAGVLSEDFWLKHFCRNFCKPT